MSMLMNEKLAKENELKNENKEELTQRELIEGLFKNGPIRIKD